MQNVSTARRPFGITIISILMFISAVIEIVGGLTICFHIKLAE